MDQQAYKNLISGQTQGLGPCLLRSLLRVSALAYGVVVRSRNQLYDWGALKSHRAAAPVICIGNLTAGGTGKTPLVIWLYRYIRRITKANCAILTRGYRSSQTSADEPALFMRHCAEAKLVVDPDRIAGAQKAVQHHAARIIIMDDGFQHRRLARDLDIITVDATGPYGLDRMLPAGLLREPLSGLKRAQGVVITRSDQVSEGELATIEQNLLAINPLLVLARARHAPSSVRLLNQVSIPCASLAGKRIFAFCGIGNPQAFFRTLSQLGADLVGTRIYDDHHHCAPADIQSLCARATQVRAHFLLTTEKNAADLEALDCSSGPPLGYLEVELAFTQGQDALCDLIVRTLASRIPELIDTE